MAKGLSLMKPEIVPYKAPEWFEELLEIISLCSSVKGQQLIPYADAGQGVRSQALFNEESEKTIRLCRVPNSWGGNQDL